MQRNVSKDLESNFIKEDVKPDLLSSYDYISKISNFKENLDDVQLIASIENIYRGVSTGRKNRAELVNKGSEYKFPFCLVKILESFQDVLSSKLSLEDEKLIKDFSFSSCLIGIARNSSNFSTKFRKEFQESDGVEIIFKYLNDGNLIKRYQDMKDVDNKMKNLLNGTCRGLLGALINLSKSWSSFKEKWKKENPIEKILDLSERLKDVDDCQLACYIILATIAEEEEIPKFPSLMNVLPCLIDLVAKMAEQLETKIDLKRTNVELGDDESSKNVCRLVFKSTAWNIIELLDALYKMAVNDSIKECIYFEHKMNKHLRTIIKFGNNVEINYAVKLLWQLCFNYKISEDVYSDKEFFKLLNDISVNSNNDQGLNTNSSGCVWVVNQKHFDQILGNQNKMRFKSERSDALKHIMISYNRENRDLCLKIKQDLERNGHKIWIDVESIHGSGLESMAIAIEESKCVLICMTEKYKQSSNCRAEAEYAFQLNKPIIPLIMQENYKPDGWLGIILGSKIFVNFTKYDYDECVRRVKSELENLLKPHVSTINKTTVVTPIRPTKDCVEDWNDEKVEDWFEEKNFNKVIHDNVFPSDGKILKQLYEMMQNAPEFFYTSISSNNAIPTRDVAYFASELKNIFKNA